MSEEEKTRADEVQEFKINIENTREDARHIKEMAQKNIEDSRSLCVDVDTIDDSLFKENLIADTLTKDVVDNIPQDDWNHIRGQFEQAAHTERIMRSLRRDMEGTRKEISAYTTLVNASTSSNSASGSSLQSVLWPHADRFPPVREALNTVQFLPTWVDDIEFIRQGLTKIMPTVLDVFNSVVADMSATGNPNLAHKALLSFRSVIFYQLLDAVAPEVVYCQTPWFGITPPKTPFKQMRFCQAKFFMIGSRDESVFPQSIMDAVNKTGMELQEKFNQMSDYGKEGANVTLVQNCYRESLASFSSAIKLRAEVEKSYP